MERYGGHHLLSLTLPSVRLFIAGISRATNGKSVVLSSTLSPTTLLLFQMVCLGILAIPSTSSIARVDTQCKHLSELTCLAFWKTNQTPWRYLSRSANDATACSHTFSTFQCYVCPRRKSGLGLGIANMMADHGAKHLVFLSRSVEARMIRNCKKSGTGACALTLTSVISQKLIASPVFSTI